VIRLIPFAPGDIPRLVGWIPDATALMLWAGPRYAWPLTEAQIERERTRADANPDALRMYVARDENNQPVGHIEIGDVDRIHGLAHLQRIMVAPTAHGRGIGRTMVEQTLRICFDELKSHRVELVALENNSRAIATYAKLGFVREGLAPEARLMPDGTRVGRVYMGLLARDWRARNTA